MKRACLLLLLSVFTGLILVSCTKHGPEGPIGARGSQGPKGDHGDAGNDGSDGANGADGSDGADGQNGADGANGADGEQGPPGTANVIYSNWIANDDLSMTWEDTLVGSPVSDPEHVTRAIEFAPDITTGILDSGVVLSYIRNQGTILSPQLLPWSFSFDDGNGVGNMWYCQLNMVPQDGHVFYYISNLSTHNADGLSFNTSYEFRYIIIPGGVLASGRKRNPKTMTYSEICKTYNIPQ